MFDGVMLHKQHKDKRKEGESTDAEKVLQRCQPLPFPALSLCPFFKVIFQNESHPEVVGSECFLNQYLRTGNWVNGA